MHAHIHLQRYIPSHRISAWCMHFGMKQTIGPNGKTHPERLANAPRLEYAMSNVTIESCVWNVPAMPRRAMGPTTPIGIVMLAQTVATEHSVFESLRNANQNGKTGRVGVLLHSKQLRKAISCKNMLVRLLTKKPRTNVLQLSPRFILTTPIFTLCNSRLAGTLMRELKPT